jgi:hypothetical protein
MYGNPDWILRRSGHPQGENSLVVCGHVSEARKWERFEAQWKRALTDAGIQGPFHMADLMACAKTFDGWRGRTEDRVQLLATLISIIKRNVYKAFSEMVLLDDWREVNEMYKLDDSHCTPYALASFYVMDRTIRWWGRRRPNDSMTEFVFEEGDKHKCDFMWMMDRVVRQNQPQLAIAIPVFKPKTLGPLQAADLAGWTMRRAARVWLTRDEERALPESIRQRLVELAKVPHRAGYLNREHITNFCRDHGVPRRGESARWAGIVKR